MKRIVLTADDYGLHPEVSRLIVGLLVDGLISSTTMIVSSPHARDAVSQYLASGADPARLRLHFNLTSPVEGPPWYPLATEHASLVGPDGAFHAHEPELEAKAESSEVIAELQAQFDWMETRGLKPAGIDVHRHIVYGLFGRGFLPEVLVFCSRRHLPFRLPKDPTLQFGHDFTTRHAAQLDAAVDAADTLQVPLPTVIASLPPGADREFTSYEEVLDRYLAILDAVPDDGVSEVFLHPIPSTQFGPQTHVWEARLLADPRFREALADFEVRPSWR